MRWPPTWRQFLSRLLRGRLKRLRAGKPFGHEADHGDVDPRLAGSAQELLALPR